MANKKNWLGILVMALVFGMVFIGCDIIEATDEVEDDENTLLNGDETTEVTDEVYAVNAPANGTLFSAVGTYADITSFAHEGKQWWVMAHWEYDWADADAKWDAVKVHNGTPGGVDRDYYTRIAYQIPKEAEKYTTVTFTYDLIFIGGGASSIWVRNSSVALGGANANLETISRFLNEGENQTFSLPMSAFYNNPIETTDDGWIAFTKDESFGFGAMLLRISKIEFTNETTDEGSGNKNWNYWVQDEKPAYITANIDPWPLNNNSISLYYSEGIMEITVKDQAPVEYPQRWLANVGYTFKGEAGKEYEYKFEAWTESGERTINVQWYDDPVTPEYISVPVELTTDHKIFTVTGDKVLGNNNYFILSFQCADIKGIFYIKIISIEEISGGSETGIEM